MFAMSSELSPANTNDRESNVITVVVADDHPVVRKALRYELEREGDFQILAEASDGEEAVRFVKELNPDIVIMDIGMPKLNGIVATRQIKASSPETIVLVLTIYDDIEHVLEILKSGADGYLTKNVPVGNIIKSLRSAVSGEAVLSPQIFQQVLRYAIRYSPQPLRLIDDIKLTTRELEVLKLVAKGMSNKQISHELNVGTRTIKSHLVDIFSKLKVSSRTEAIVTLLRAGFLTIDDLD
jgi:DNA-binding NarL/FixJ family response regulator